MNSRDNKYKEVFNILKNEKRTKKEIKEIAGIKNKQLYLILKNIKESGIQITEQNIGTERYYFISSILTPGNTYFLSGKSNGLTVLKKGIMSDTHLNGWSERLDILKDLYEWYKKHGVNHVYHSGDLTEGAGTVYKGQMNHIKHYGFDKTVEYVVENYPKIGGLETILIGGNHDEDFYNKFGADICREISNKRNDFKYMGSSVGDFIEAGIRFRLLHPMGKMPYSKSYKGQTYIRNLEPQNKPNVIFGGHLHTFAWFNESGVEYIQAPGMCGATDLTMKLGLGSQIGGLLGIFYIEDGKVKDIELKRRFYG